MGAIDKEARIYGRTLSAAFKNIQDADEEESGTDIYSGGWNNISGVREVDKKTFDNYEPSKHEPAVALCIKKPIGNDMKVKTTVTNFPNTGTRKWVTKYQVDDVKWGNVIISEDKQADAIKKARALVEKNPDWELEVYIAKELQTSTKVAKINYKKASKERHGVWEIKGCASY